MVICPRPVLAGGDDLELDREEWTTVRPREILAEQWSQFEGYMPETFTAMGMPGAAATVTTRTCGPGFFRLCGRPG